MIQLVYFPARGRSGFIRLYLGYLGISWENVVVKGREEFIELKKKAAANDGVLACTFESLPIIIDGETKISQTTAIMHYLSRKYDNAALHQSPEDETQAIALMCGAEDLRIKMFDAPLTNGTPEDHAKFKEEVVSRWFRCLTNFLKNKKHAGPFFFGEKPSYVDFSVFDICDAINDRVSGVFEGFDDLKAHYDAVKAVPAVEAVMKSDKWA